jgi:uncharacterized membrane protein
MLNTLWRMLRTRPRLVSAVLAGLAWLLLMPAAWAPNLVTRALVAWNLGVLLYLGLAGVMMLGSSHARMRERAHLESEGRWAVLGLVSLCALSSLVAIALQLGVARELQGSAKLAHMGLAGLTVLSSWAFMQTIFALHYAHEFYVARGRHAPGGLEFPGTPEPDYLDFLYVACVVGTSGQTADVSFSTQAMRRTGLLHCVLAFFFNTTVLALAINIAAGLI